MEFIWKDDKINYMFDEASKDVDNSFYAISKKKRLGFTYRENQHKFSIDIMNAIRNNQILLIQAGTGIGKSMGYLIPIFSSFKNVENFEKVVISTSSIALQKQLLDDVKSVSKLLGFNLKVEVAKGINNYVCIKEMDKLAGVTNNSDIKKILIDLEKEIREKNSIDKSDLSEICEEIWKKIQIKNRNSCSNCSYSRRCLYKHHVNEIDKADVVITNHAYFVTASRNNNNFISNADMYVFDEAHELEDSIRNINENSIMLGNIRRDVNYFVTTGFINDPMFEHIVFALSDKIGVLFYRIMSKSKKIFSKHNTDEKFKITDCDKIPIDGSKFTKEIDDIVNDLSFVINVVSKNTDVISTNDAKGVLNNLNIYRNLFNDLKLGNKSMRIYWADFYNFDMINLGFVKKEDKNAIKNIFGKDIPVICTSATMLDANGTYEYFKEWLHLNNIMGRTIVNGKVYPSTFDYEKNSIFYYDTSVSNPKDVDNYINDLVDRITNLISITDGRSLILFTAKSIMERVYEAISKNDFGYKLLMQGQMDNSVLCREFENDIHSCLFATGSFWEGIDIKGESLSNVIITRLPFAVVDAVTESKASKFSSDMSFKMVYLNDMVKKLAQGCGRLIRSKNDKGIICCLDSRVVKYLDAIRNSTPYVNYTNDINDIIKFSNKYIKKLSKK